MTLPLSLLAAWLVLSLPFSVLVGKWLKRCREASERNGAVAPNDDGSSIKGRNSSL